jgi:hypothetical protein
MAAGRRRPTIVGMYATLRTTEDTGTAGTYRLDQLGTGRSLLLALWTRREDAGPAADLYEIDDDLAGTAAAEPPAAASILHFDGPLSPARVEAARFGGRNRIRPVLATAPGVVRSLVLWHPGERKAAVVTLATSMAALEDVGAAVNSTELLPGEDPALLTGPDRVDIHRVRSLAEETLS